MIRDIYLKLKSIYAKVSHIVFSYNFLFAAGLLGGIFALIFFFLIERFTTSNPDFCLNCHKYTALTDFSRISLVHPKIRCIDCHAEYKRIKFIYTDFRAEADRINSNCERCHQNILKKDNPEGFKHNEWNINIPHRFHLEEAGARCVDCHSNIYHDKTSSPTNRPKMEACFQCHEWGATKCTKCHPKGAVKLPHQELASRAICRECHQTFDDKTVNIYGTQFIHKKHTLHGINCNICHSNKEKHGTIILSLNNCNNCHHQQKGINCTQCHATQNKFRTGKLLEKITSSQEPMFGQVECNNCHSQVPGNLSLIKENCKSCHGIGYKEKVDEWQNKYSDLLRGTHSLIAWVESKKKGMNENNIKTIDANLSEAKDILNTLEKDGSKGVHNHEYAVEIISQANERVKRALHLIQK